jgi:streptogramin lyase
MSDMAGAGWTTTSPVSTGTTIGGLASNSLNQILFTASAGNPVNLRPTLGGTTQSLGNFTAGTGALNFAVPNRIATDSNNRILTSDTGRRNVARFDSITATTGTQIDLGALTFTSGPVAYDPSDRVYVMNPGSKWMLRYDNIDGSGLASFTWTDSSIIGFKNPQDIFIDSGSKIYIADTDNNRIARMDNLAGVGFRTFGALGSGVGQFNKPSAVWVDAAGKIYVADTGNNRIVRMDGMSGLNWTEISTQPGGSGTLASPSDILVID